MLSPEPIPTSSTTPLAQGTKRARSTPRAGLRIARAVRCGITYLSHGGPTWLASGCVPGRCYHVVPMSSATLRAMLAIGVGLALGACATGLSGAEPANTVAAGSPEHHHRWAAEFVRWGYVVLVLDSVGPAGFATSARRPGRSR